MCAVLHQDDDDDDDDDGGKNTTEPGNQELFSGKICKIISSCISITLKKLFLHLQVTWRT